MKAPKTIPPPRIGQAPTTSHEVGVGTTVHLYPNARSRAFRALSEWMHLSSLSALQLALIEDELYFSLLLRMEGRYLSLSTLETSGLDRMRVLLKSLKLHLKRFEIEMDEGGIDILTMKNGV
jgi:hypothetical protein